MPRILRADFAAPQTGFELRAFIMRENQRHMARQRTSTESRCTVHPKLGRGIGATAAHELGHQAGLGFATDSRCEDCYDGNTSTRNVHFFGEKHWSDAALTRMKHVLPPA